MSGSCTSTTHSVDQINQIIERLKSEQFCNSTSQNYLFVWRLFNKFVVSLDYRPKGWESKLALFAAHLVQKGVQSSTLKSYLAAIRSTLKVDGKKIQDDNLELQAIVRACKLENDTLKVRLLIDVKLLEILLFEVKQVFRKDMYLEKMYKAVLLLGYYRLMHVGELTLSPHVLKAKDIHIARNKNKLLIVLYSSKTHSNCNNPQEIKITGTMAKKVNFFCPFKAIRSFIDIRGSYLSDDELFFILQGRLPLKAEHIRNMLRRLLSNVNLNSSLYDTHSLRIGRTCQLFKMGISIEKIKKIGRWKSNAVYRYIRNIL